MTLLGNNWTLIREFYAMSKAKIENSQKNEWAIDPYSWDIGVVNMTPIERWLWHDIRSLDVVMYPQYPVGKFFVDFANPAAKVAIECDGREFHMDKAKDSARDKAISDLGWHVYRISGSDCRHGVDLENQSESKAREFVFRVANNHDLFRDGEWARNRHSHALSRHEYQ